MSSNPQSCMNFFFWKQNKTISWKGLKSFVQLSGSARWLSIRDRGSHYKIFCQEKSSTCLSGLQTMFLHTKKITWSKLFVYSEKQLVKEKGRICVREWIVLQAGRTVCSAERVSSKWIFLQWKCMAACLYCSSAKTTRPQILKLYNCGPSIQKDALRLGSAGYCGWQQKSVCSHWLELVVWLPERPENIRYLTCLICCLSLQDISELSDSVLEQLTHRDRHSRECVSNFTMLKMCDVHVRFFLTLNTTTEI